MNNLLMQKRFKLIIMVGIVLTLSLLQFHLKSKLAKPTFSVSKQDEALNINENIIKIFSLGQTRLISSLLWVHTLLESDIENYKNDDLNSWMYLRFKSISELEPLFYSNYLFGGQYLSIIKDDLLGAQDIYERGLVHYPDNFWLRFYNGFNYYFELKQLEPALENYAVIENHPLTAKHAPYLPTLLAKMRVQSGQTQMAYDLLYTIYQNTDELSPLRPRQKEMLYQLKAQIDLSCLNEQENDDKKCDRFDFENRPYILSNGKYKAQRDLETN